MRFSSIRVTNYKSFADSGEIALREGMNVVTGRNDSGKTALLEAMSLRFTNHPHRTSRSVPDPFRPGDSSSNVDVQIVIGRDELREVMRRRMRDFHIAVPRDRIVVGDLVLDPSSPDALTTFVRSFLNREELVLTFRVVNGEVQQDLLSVFHNVFDPAPQISSGHRLSVRFKLGDDDEASHLSGPALHSGANDFTVDLAALCARSIYAFRAERLPTDRTVKSEAELAPDARNLHRVLATLVSNKGRFRTFLELVRRVLPNITDLSVPIDPQSGEYDIRLWKEASLDRDDLTVSLAESGSGVGHVLAIAYLLATSHEPRIIPDRRAADVPARRRCAEVD